MLVDQTLSSLPDELDIDSIRGIVNEHTAACPQEVNVFQPFVDIEDVLAIEDGGQRKTALRSIADAMDAVNDRRRRLATLLHAVDETTIADEEDLKEFQAAKRQLLGGMDNHIPDTFIALGSKLGDRVDTLCMTKEEKEDRLQEELQGFSPEDKARHLETFKVAVEPRSMSKLERFDFYFDQLVEAPSVAELQAIGLVQNELIQKAHRVRDAGGSLDEVKSVLDHIPQTFWPPEFVEELQAWRKTERALMQERIAESARKQEEGAMQTVEGVCAFFADRLGDVAAFAGVDDLAVVNDYVDNWRKGWGGGKDFVEACQNCDFSKTTAQQRSEKLDLIATETARVVSTVKNMADIAGKASQLSDETFLMGTFIPGLTIAIAGIELTSALKALAEHSYISHQSEGMKELAKLELARREQEDGGAFIRAMDNEIGARHRQVTKDCIEVTVKSVELAGGIVELTAGPAAPAGTVLKIVGKSINYGGKIIFTNIDWNIANRAKDLIAEAQAGNPVARMQIFEDCGLYAKMYICVLCKEGHPLSLKFIEQRGIEEADLDDVTSMKILRDLLLDSADQKDETQVEDGWLAANTGAVGRAAKALANKVSRISKSSNKPYDATWRPPAVNLTKATWEEVKAGARSAGWHEDPTGIAAALENVSEPLSAAEATWNDQVNGSNFGELNLAARDALRAAYSTVQQCSPMTCPHDDGSGKTVVVAHKGMCIYIDGLIDALRAKLNTLDEWVTKKNLRDLTWSTTDNALSSTQWQNNWSEAVEQAWLPNQEPGLTAILQTIESKDPSSAPTAQAKRQVTIEKLDALKQFTKAAGDYWGQCSEVDGMRNYLTVLQREAADQAKTLDTELFEVVWSNPGANMTPDKMFSAEGWQVTWTAACEAAVCSQAAGDGGLLSALQNLDAKRTVLQSNPTGKALLAARIDAAKAAASVYAKAASFTSAQKNTVEGVYAHVKSIIDQCSAYVIGIDNERATVTFEPDSVGSLVAHAIWYAAYQDAVAKGALPENSKASTLRDAMKDYDAEVTKLEGFRSSKSFKDQRVSATKVHAAIGTIVTAIGKVESGDGYTSHPIMGNILMNLRKLANDALVEQALQDAMAGKMRSGFSLPTDFAPDNWSDTKADAISKGVIPDAKTGMKAVIKSAESGIANLTKASPEKQATAKEAAEAALQALESHAASIKQLSQHENWHSYCDSITRWVVTQKAAL